MSTRWELSLRGFAPQRQGQVGVPCSGSRPRTPFFNPLHHGGWSARRDWVSENPKVWLIMWPTPRPGYSPFPSNRTLSTPLVSDFGVLRSRQIRKAPTDYYPRLVFDLDRP